MFIFIKNKTKIIIIKIESNLTATHFSCIGLYNSSYRRKKFTCTRMYDHNCSSDFYYLKSYQIGSQHRFPNIKNKT